MMSELKKNINKRIDGFADKLDNELIDNSTIYDMKRTTILVEVLGYLYDELLEMKEDINLYIDQVKDDD